MSRKGEDPMSGLLSSVGGIDSSLFQRPQSMRDMRGNQAPPAQKDPAPSAPKPQQAAPSTQSAASAYGFAYKGTQPSTANQVSPRPGPASQSSSRAGFSSQSKEASNSQLDALLGGSVVAKKGRPMREASKPGGLNVQSLQSGQPPRPVQQYEAVSPPSGSATVSSPTQAAPVHDDLDNVFGPGNSFSSQQSRPQAAAAHDPFALFGGLGTTEQHRTVSQQPSAEDDILGGFSSGVGSPPSYQLPRQRSTLKEADLQDEALVAKPSPPSSVQSRRSFHSTAGSGDWGGMVGAHSSNVASPLAGAAAPEDVFDADVASPTAASPSAARGREEFGRLSSSEELRTSGSQPLPQRPPAAEPQPPPPPSYESVTRASKGPVSPRSHIRGHHGSGKYQAYKDEDSSTPKTSAQQQSSFSKRHAPRRSSSSSSERMQQQMAPDRRQQMEHGQTDMKDQAKQWLSAGQKWLSSAGKKVAQAVKETQTQINLKLEELEGHGSQSNGAARSQQHPVRQKSRSDSSSSLSDIPAYYFEWAETVQALPAHEQGATLAAMPDDDARTIQRILRHRAAKRASFEETESAIMAEAQRRSLSEQRLQQRASRNLSPTNVRTLRSHSSELTSNSSGLASPPPDRPAPVRKEPDMPQRVAHMPEGRQPSLPQPQQQQQADASADFIGLHPEPQQRRPQAVPAPPHPPDGTDDLMGLHGQPSLPKAAQQTPQPPEHDILGMSHPAAQSSRSASAGLEQMFSAPAPSRAMSQRPEDIFAEPPPNMQPRAPQPGSAPDSMIDFGEEAGLSHHESLYQPGTRDMEQEGEPEARKIARRKRLAETQARMQRQLAEKQARDKADLQKQEAQHDLRSVHQERIAAWKSGKKDNIRALLATLHTVLWDNSGWTAPGMTDLVEPGRVKRSYMKANLVVHPDKVKQKGGTVEQIVIADMAFDTLKTAWSKFEASELRGR